MKPILRKAQTAAAHPRERGRVLITDEQKSMARRGNPRVMKTRVATARLCVRYATRPHLVVRAKDQRLSTTGW